MEKGPKGGVEIFKKRRKILMDKTKDGVVIIPSMPEVVRNNDVNYPFRQDSSFYYMSGFIEPESVIVLDASSKTPLTMFVRERDPSRELWDGFRYGLDGAAQYFGADKTYPIKEFADHLPELIKNTEKVYYKLNEYHETDKIVLDAMEKARRMKGRTGLGAPTLIDVKQVVGEMRLFKSAEEVELLKKACEISSRGHLAGMQATKSGKMEFEIEAAIEGEFRRLGADRVGYTSIIGTGANGTVLHYVFNNDKLKDGDLLLVDAGAEYGYLTGDITRTFPVSGKFTAPQKKIYNSILRVQKECVAMVKPGVRLAEVHQHAIDGLTEAMLELGLMKGNHKEIVEKTLYKRYFPHGTSHWLGMDVHDSGVYMIDGQSRKLEPGMCFTVEPGLYVPEDDKEAPAEYRGIGIRIEDDIHVVAGGCENMTILAPKEIEELEATVGRA
jgi:Xaa-Pro aminopeptidase